MSNQQPNNDDQSPTDSDSSDTKPKSDDDAYLDSIREEMARVRQEYELAESEDTPEANIRQFTEKLYSEELQKEFEEDEEDLEFDEDKFNFPEDKDKWTEQDLQELWADRPMNYRKPGWDPVWADNYDWEVMRQLKEAGQDPPIAPFYLPYRKPYPVVPENNFDIRSPKDVVEELDRMEEFLVWASYIFPDGSTYEGTIFNDLAHGKGVYVAEDGLVRYEGEWLQNNPEGHGVIEVDIPDIEPIPGSKLEEKMRAEGKIIKRDFMDPEDRRWLEMDIEDSVKFANGAYEIPFYENEEWVKQFGRKPEKGRYRYAGQWKHGRVHGCGLYEVNERPTIGRFYFGELLEDSTGCDEETVALHAGLAEVAAAKARMFTNKPDGMVREQRGPYGDPQHPYFYEEEDVWMAPGFINQFYEVPDYWKLYVHEVDQEREMWLNSFYKSPFRIPMPPELEYWWEHGAQPPEFIVVNKEPEPDPEDPSKLIYTEDPLILHTPTGRLINYIEDEKYGVRLFWQPPLKEGEEPDPEKVEFLPLGFDEFYGIEEDEEKPNLWRRLVMALGDKSKPFFEKIEKWADEKKNASETKIQVIEKELDLVEAELSLEEALEEMDEELSLTENADEDKGETGLAGEKGTSLTSEAKNATAMLKEDKAKVKVVGEDRDEDEDDEGEDEDEEEDEDAPTSFGTVTTDHSSSKNGEKGKKPGDAPFSSSSLSFASCSLVSLVPSKLQNSFISWKQGRWPQQLASSHVQSADSNQQSETIKSVAFPFIVNQKGRVKTSHQKSQKQNLSNGKNHQLHSLSRVLVSSKRVTKASGSESWSWMQGTNDYAMDSILSLQIPLSSLKSYKDNTSSFVYNYVG